LTIYNELINIYISIPTAIYRY